MELKEHFDSYRESFKKTMFKNYENHLKNTDCSEVFPNMWEFINYLIATIKTRIEGGDRVGYLEKLRKHQEAMLSVFEQMALPYATYDGITDGPCLAGEWLGMINDWGWHWFRYAKCPGIQVSFRAGLAEEVRFIPRYIPERKEFWSGVTPCFDAEEMMLFQDKSDEVMVKVLRMKAENPALKFFDDFTSAPVESCNSDEIVRDWSLPL